MSKRNVPAPTQLRQRMIEDMTVRNLSPATQASYITAVKRFSQYHERSPAALGLEDVRAYQVHLVQHRIAWASLNQIVSALRFVYGVTLGRKDWPRRALRRLWAHGHFLQLLPQQALREVSGWCRARMARSAPG